MKIKTTIKYIALAGVMLLNSICMPVHATKSDTETFWPKGPSVESQSAIVMEASTGTVLYGKNINKKRYPASITKIMTTLLAVENSEMNETVTFSADAVYSIDRGSTHIARDVDEQMTMEETLYAVMLGSANECAYATGEHVGGGGSYRNFIDMMNERAKELGCENTHFNNAHGLPDDNHYTTAYDMALISRAAIQNETFKLITGTDKYTIPPTNKHKESTPITNHHAMLTFYKTSQHLYDYCIGGKTGYTNAARNTLVTYAEKDGMTLICVVMKAETPNHYTDTRKLLDYCFDNFQLYKISENEKTYSDDHIGNYMTFDGNNPIFSLDDEGVIVLPKSAAFEEASPQISYDGADAESGVAATLEYFYGNRRVGGTQIKVEESKVEEFLFGNESGVKEDGTEQKVIEVKWQWIVFGGVAFVVLAGLIALAIYLSRNFYIIRHNMRMRKRDKMRRLHFKEKRRRRRIRRHRR